MPDKSESAKKFLEIDVFLNNAFVLINTATKLISNARHKNRSLLKQLLELLEKMLHSIFFIGNIRLPQFSPEDIFEKDMYVETRRIFQGPFQDYKTCVAGRTPFSYFLELVWRCKGSDDDSDIRDTLSDTRLKCKSCNDRYALIPAVIAVIHVSDKRNKRKYYGASVSCMDGCREPLTLLSCWHDWHPDVQSAVMSVFPDSSDNARWIKLKEDKVSCKAYTVQNIRKEIDPCGRCHQLYCLPNHTDYPNYPGNCAETEAISNLLKSEENVVLNKTTNPENQGEIRKKMKNYFKTNRGKYSINHVYIPAN